MGTNIKSKEYFENFFKLQLDDLNYYENSLKEGKVKEDRVIEGNCRLWRQRSII